MSSQNQPSSGIVPDCSSTDPQATLPPQTPPRTRIISIAGIQEQTSFSFLPIDGCEFHDPPHDLLITRPPSLQRGKDMPTWEWTQWGANDDFLFSSALCFDCYAKTPDPDTGEYVRFKLKMALHVEQGSGAPEEVAGELKQEAEYYMTHLARFQGNHVPKHYGIWTAQTTWGGSVVCAMLEYAGIPFKLRGPYDTRQARDAFAALVLDLHRHGVRHGQLVWPHITWHMLWDVKQGIPRVVDFKQACYHFDCSRSLPLCRYDSAPLKLLDCDELVRVGRYLELFGKRPVNEDEEVQEALKVLKRYQGENNGKKGYTMEESLLFQEAWLNWHRRQTQPAPA